MEKDTERLFELTLFRAESKLTQSLGEEFNNETLMLVNALPKARATIDLSLGSGSDAGHGMMLEKSAEGLPVPFDIIITRMIRKTEYEVLDGNDPDIASDMLHGPCGFPEGEAGPVFEELRKIERRVSLSFRNRMDRGILSAAKRYILIMTSPGLDFPYRDILARLFLYRDLIRTDERLSGMNIEQALLIRREDHDRCVQSGDVKAFTLLLSECILESVYSGCDRLEASARSADAAVRYLSRFLEKDRPYTVTEIGDILGVSREDAAALFVLPAISSDRMAVEPVRSGEDLYRLIV